MKRTMTKMAAKSKYNGVKAAIAGVAAGAVVVGAGYFAANNSTRPTGASAYSAPSASASVATTGSTPLQNSVAAPPVTSNSAASPDPTVRPSVAKAPKAKKSRGS